MLTLGPSFIAYKASREAITAPRGYSWCIEIDRAQLVTCVVTDNPGCSTGELFDLLQNTFRASLPVVFNKALLEALNDHLVKMELDDTDGTIEFRWYPV